MSDDRRDIFIIVSSINQPNYDSEFFHRMLSSLIYHHIFIMGKYVKALLS